MTPIQEAVPEQEMEEINLVNVSGENNGQKAPSKIRGKPGKSSKAKVVFLDACIPSTGGNRSGISFIIINLKCATLVITSFKSPNERIFHNNRFLFIKTMCHSLSHLLRF